MVFTANNPEIWAILAVFSLGSNRGLSSSNVVLSSVTRGNGSLYAYQLEPKTHKKGMPVFLNNEMVRTSDFQVSKLCLKVKGGPGLTAYSLNKTTLLLHALFI